jgi:hypothetical protein
MKIKFSTTDKLAFENFPPIPAKKLLPDWYKQLALRPEKMDAKQLIKNGISVNSFTIKGCTPVADYLTNGYILRASSDILITPERQADIKDFWWVSKHARVGTHVHGQCPIKINNANNVYIKILLDWCIETPKGYSCYFYQPEFFFQDKFRLLPAIVDTDTYKYPINFPGLVLAEDTFTIAAGTPLMVVFPFKREDWDSEINYLTEERLSPVRLYFERGYKKLFHKQKNFN